MSGSVQVEFQIWSPNSFQLLSQLIIRKLKSQQQSLSAWHYWFYTKDISEKKNRSVQPILTQLLFTVQVHFRFCPNYHYISSLIFPLNKVRLSINSLYNYTGSVALTWLYRVSTENRFQFCKRATEVQAWGLDVRGVFQYPMPLHEYNKRWHWTSRGEILIVPSLGLESRNWKMNSKCYSVEVKMCFTDWILR